VNEERKYAPASGELGLVGMIAWFFAGSSWVWITILAIGAIAIAIRLLR
jgi:ABC-type phosphate transport system auxiliary subunit